MSDPIFDGGDDDFLRWYYGGTPPAEETAVAVSAAEVKCTVWQRPAPRRWADGDAPRKTAKRPITVPPMQFERFSESLTL